MKKITLRVLASVFYAMFLFAIFANIQGLLSGRNETLVLTVRLLFNPDNSLQFPYVLWVHLVGLSLPLLIVIAPLLIGRFLWNLKSAESHSDPSFAWWKIQGWILLSYSIYAVIQLGLHGWLQSAAPQKYLIFLALLALGLASFLSIRMNIKAFIAITIFSLNPYLWIINIIYLKRRWNSQRIKGLESLRNRNSR
jgi:hypothetical protein